MIELLSICAELADCLHYLRGVRFSHIDNVSNQDLIKALELGEKAHTDLLRITNNDTFTRSNGETKMIKQLNPLQGIIDEMHKNKLLHSQLAKNAESENNRYNSNYNYIHFEHGVAYGFKLAIEIIANFKFWNNACINPPKFDENRINPHYPPFACVVKYDNGEYNLDRCYYDFNANQWKVGVCCQVVFWQEYSILPKEILEWEFR